MPAVLVGRQAPNFITPAVMGNGEIVENFNFHEHIKGKKAVLFFYPLDWTLFVLLSYMSSISVWIYLESVIQRLLLCR